MRFWLSIVGCGMWTENMGVAFRALKNRHFELYFEVAVKFSKSSSAFQFQNWSLNFLCEIHLRAFKLKSTNIHSLPVQKIWQTLFLFVWNVCVENFRNVEITAKAHLQKPVILRKLNSIWIALFFKYTSFVNHIVSNVLS